MTIVWKCYILLMKLESSESCVVNSTRYCSYLYLVLSQACARRLLERMNWNFQGRCVERTLCGKEHEHMSTNKQCRDRSFCQLKNRPDGYQEPLFCQL